MANGGLLSFLPRAARELIYLIFAGPCRFGRIAMRCTAEDWPWETTVLNVLLGRCTLERKTTVVTTPQPPRIPSKQLEAASMSTAL